MFQWETADPLRFSSTQLKFPWSLASLGRGFYCPQPPWPSLTVFNSFPREEKWGVGVEKDNLSLFTPQTSELFSPYHYVYRLVSASSSATPTHQGTALLYSNTHSLCLGRFPCNSAFSVSYLRIRTLFRKRKCCKQSQVIIPTE